MTITFLGASPKAIKNDSDEGVLNYFDTFNEAVSNGNFKHTNTLHF